jgi:carbon-monoxide dehydrogenase iron sulfur subunit
MRKLYVKDEVCIACHLCEVYCQLHHAPGKDLVKVFKGESRTPLPRVRVEENGPVSLSVRCQHCEDAQCLYACLTGAISRDPNNGQIKVDEEKCIGCWTCMLVCSFGAIKKDEEQEKTIRCNLCEGEDIPACVANCPNEALICLDDENTSSKDDPDAVTFTK